jgi:5-methylcytosine-specific restriction protein A
MPTTDDFRRELAAQMKRAAQQGRPHLEVNAGELHRKVGGYPPKSGKLHSIPSCCNAMRQTFDEERDVIVYETDSGNAPALTIRYALPR